MPDSSTPVNETFEALDQIIEMLPGGGEHRQGQRDMASIIAETIESNGHVVVQAGTGTGKSLAYLVPTVLSGQRTVIATATKALQDQLAEKDLPFVAEHLGLDIDFAVLKGRGNYLCLQRLDEAQKNTSLPLKNTSLPLNSLAKAQISPAKAQDESNETTRITEFEWLDETTLDAVLQFSLNSASGDRSDLDIPLSNHAWRSLSVTRNECPGAVQCPRGHDCFAEQARAKAAHADIVIVNLHLYILSLLFPGIIVDHGTVVIDEAHKFEEIVSSAMSRRLAPSRFSALVRSGRALKANPKTCDALESTASSLQDHLKPLAGRRINSINIASKPIHTNSTSQKLNPSSDHLASDSLASDSLELLTILGAAASLVSRLNEELREKLKNASVDATPRIQRVVKSAGSLMEDINALRASSDNDIVWVDDSQSMPALRTTPLRVDELLAESLWPQRTAVLTSATIPPALKERVGLPETTVTADVGSPFNYRSNALLYCPVNLPTSGQRDPQGKRFKELETLITAAQGRTLALYTSYSAMHTAARAMRSRLQWPVLVQNTKSKTALLKEFASEEHASLFATISFWQGVDVPGRSCSLVVIDKLPFPRPDDPVLQARRDLAGTDAFRMIDLALTATLLTQGVGRLIRTTQDRGVVAVLDSRLATRHYRHTLIQALPPMRRTTNRATAINFLRTITAD